MAATVKTGPAGIDGRLVRYEGADRIQSSVAALTDAGDLTGLTGLEVDGALNTLLQSTLNAADAIYLHANGGTAETIRIHSDQGTSSNSISIESDVGGVQMVSGTLDPNPQSIIVDATETNNTITLNAITKTIAFNSENVEFFTGDRFNVATQGAVTLSGVTSVQLSTTSSSIIAIQVETTHADGGMRFRYGTGGFMKSQVAPAVATNAETLTVAKLLAQIITGVPTGGGNQDYTLPTYSALDAVFDSYDTTDSIDFTIMNLSATTTITVLANTGGTVIGTALIATNSQGTFRLFKDGASTYKCYRIAV